MPYVKVQENEEDKPVDEYENPDPVAYSKEYEPIFIAEFVSDGANVPKDSFFPLKH